MKYTTKNGYKVCDQGDVIIENVRHFVTGGFVKCDRSLNQRAWDTTSYKSDCEICFPTKEDLNQLKLF